MMPPEMHEIIMIYLGNPWKPQFLSCLAISCNLHLKFDSDTICTFAPGVFQSSLAHESDTGWCANHQLLKPEWITTIQIQQQHMAQAACQVVEKMSPATPPPLQSPCLQNSLRLRGAHRDSRAFDVPQSSTVHRNWAIRLHSLVIFQE